MELSKRLQAAADLVIAGEIAADIGTDHCGLPVYLTENNICPFVIAGEKTKTSSAVAKRKISALCMEEKISVRMGDGLAVLQQDEAATAIIAGMGGYNIIKILSDNLDITSSLRRLVLQPQSDIPAVRNFLEQNGWQIIAEKLVSESGIYYEIIAAEHGKMNLSTIEQLCGPILLRESSSLFMEYLRHRLTMARSLLSKLDEKAAEKRIVEIKEEILTLQKAVKAF